MNVTLELKPCPFCGGQVEARSVLKLPILMFKCSWCGAVVSFDNDNCNRHPDKAIDYFNRRTS